MVSVLSFFVGGTFIQHVLHQIRAVRGIYAQVDSVDLYDTQPLIAFSGLTTRAAVGLILLQDRHPGDPAGRVQADAHRPSAILTLIAVAVFVWPLLGVHRLLEEEKGEQFAAVEQRLKAVVATLYQHVENSGELVDMEQVEKTITSLKNRARHRGPTPHLALAAGDRPRPGHGHSATHRAVAATGVVAAATQVVRLRIGAKNPYSLNSRKYGEYPLSIRAISAAAFCQ